jgi:starch phosphorylase
MQLTPKRTLAVEPSLPPALEPLRSLARNLFWTWNTDTASLFERIEPGLWEATSHNPLRVLQLVPPARLADLAVDAGFLAHVSLAKGAFDEYLGRTPQVAMGRGSSQPVVAYFSLEFALSESIPMYSGGLGVLAGDHLKSASDLGLPLVGVSLLYREGYFHQALAPDGWQLEDYQPLDPATLPFAGRVRDDSGTPLRVHLQVEGRDVAAEVWRCDVGSVPVFFLDSGLEENTPADRAICSRLYGGDSDLRIRQEMLLGIGGYRALQAMGIEPAVCHMNEGHSGLMAVERTRALMERSGATFEEARIAVAASTVFTTHTAVAAGIDLFPPELVVHHLRSTYGSMGLDDRAFLGLGRIDAGDMQEPFSMALLGIRMSGYRNGVSALHGSVSRRLWERAWPNLPEEQVPISSITNGVHLPTWVSHDMGMLYDRYVGRGWRDDPTGNANWDGIHAVSDALLWATHDRERRQLVQRARLAYRGSAERRGIPQDPRLGEPLDPGILTIGFARRFAQYKRATLLLRDIDRLARLVNDPDRPVQFIFAGKAHPRDDAAKQLIREVVAASKRPELRDRIVVLERYDVDLARALVQGCDAWLNTPLRPLEASGTSGMKAVANGGLHVSVRDGWWAEAYGPGFGWAIGSETPNPDNEIQDLADAESLYSVLENEIAPAFYDRDADGIPRKWVGRMKDSIANCAHRFSTHRMVGEYAERAYVPASEHWGALTLMRMAAAREAARFLQTAADAWPGMRVLSVTDDAGDEISGEAAVNVRATIARGGVPAENLHVELLYGEVNASGALVETRSQPMPLVETSHESATFSAGFQPPRGGRAGYTIRVTPRHRDLPAVIDTGLVLWA